MILSGKTAVITGASRGIGKGVALRFSAEGANIVLTGRNKNALETLEEELSTSGTKVLSVAGDITDLNDLENLRNTVVKRFGTVDILINNAGVSVEKPFLELTPEEWEYIHKVNLTGTMLCTRTFSSGNAGVRYRCNCKCGIRCRTSRTSGQYRLQLFQGCGNRLYSCAGGRV